MGVNEEETFKKFGYKSIDLSPKSNKLIIAICEVCGDDRELKKSEYHVTCKKCSMREITSRPERNEKISKAHMGCTCSDETKQKMSKAHIGYTHSNESKQKMSKAHMGCTCSDETRQRMSMAKQNITDETRQRMSAAKQDISYDEWEEFVSEQKYCPAFNEKCRESNREKYNRRCFLCNKSEEENGRKLSVHHVDMDKGQGCDGKRWKLIPTCISCHNSIHNKLWETRIIYLLENV